MKILKTLRSFGAEIYNGIHTLNEAFEECINLKDKFDKFNEFPRLKSQNKKEGKALTCENVKKVLEGRQRGFNAFEGKMFSIKKPDKILTP